MSLQIFYTPRFKTSLQSVYDFINSEFGLKPAEKFALKVETIIELITQHPLMYKASSIDNNVRIGVISKQTSLFYRVTDTAIHLLFLWDNRQEPLLF